jgi:hypothetical protein
MKEHYLKVGDLLKVIKENNLPDDIAVCYHRIEDGYFDGWDISKLQGSKQGDKSKGWDTINIKGDAYYHAVKHNKDVENANLVKSGKGGDSNLKSKWLMENDIQKFDLDDEKLLDQYIEGTYCFYNKEKNVLCITAHY